MRRSLPARRLFLFACIALSACAHATRQHDVVVLPAGVMRGRFIDEYGNRFEVSDSLFAQLPSGQFHIVEWRVPEQFVIARNDARNASDAGLWTRIDWMPLAGMAPYTWAFCFTEYRAPTRDAALRTRPADRTTPRTGCNGYPFSRMRPDGQSPPR